MGAYLIGGADESRRVLNARIRDNTQIAEYINGRVDFELSGVQTRGPSLRITVAQEDNTYYAPKDGQREPSEGSKDVVIKGLLPKLLGEVIDEVDSVDRALFF